MNIQRNIRIRNPKTKGFLADAYYPQSEEKLPLVVFLHGYKGYKDWGAWELMCIEMAKQGFYVVKFNTSHNGTTMEKPSEFTDLEAFGENNYSKELSDTAMVIDFFTEKSEVEESSVTLIGHSRGGGLSIIQASENPKIKTLITLASVSSLNRFPKGEKFQEWKEKGVYTVLNGRTGQQMPHYFQFFEDYQNHEYQLNIERKMKNFDKPYLIIHGNNDTAVDITHAAQLKAWNTDATLVTIDGANHTFGAKEPWEEKQLPSELQKAIDRMIDFLQNQDDN